MGTESQLWGKLKRVIEQKRTPSTAFTRIETGLTHLGVADVEYTIGAGWHGWIELKVCDRSRDDAVMEFRSEFTPAQFTWLLLHHYLPHHLCSWLLIWSPRRQKSFCLVPAPKSIIFPSFTGINPARTLMKQVETQYGYSSIEEVVHVIYNGPPSPKG